MFTKVMMKLAKKEIHIKIRSLEDQSELFDASLGVWSSTFSDISSWRKKGSRLMEMNKTPLTLKIHK